MCREAEMDHSRLLWTRLTARLKDDAPSLVWRGRDHEGERSKVSALERIRVRCHNLGVSINNDVVTGR
jgi:hypothetical protein